MEQQQEVFKVVKIEGEKYVSAVETGAYKLEYLSNEVTKPKRGKIFAFSSLEFAKQFKLKELSSSYQTWEIWKARGKNPESIDKICTYPDKDEKFWKGFILNKMYLGHSYEGTIVVDELELLEKIE